MISVNVLIAQKDPDAPFFTLVEHNRRCLLIWAPYDRWLGLQILHSGIFDIGLSSKFLFQLHFIFQIIDIFDREKTFHEHCNSVLFDCYHAAVGEEGRPYAVGGGLRWYLD